MQYSKIELPPIQKMLKKFKAHRIDLVAIRMAGVGFTTVGSFLAIKCFMAYGSNKAAIFMGILGLANFLPLAQFGFGRPSYSYIMKNFSKKSFNKNIINSILRFTSIKMGLAVIIFVISVNAWFESEGGAYIYLTDKAYFFSFVISILAVSGYQRDLSYATNNEYSFEVLDTVRKFLGVIFYCFLLAGFEIYWPSLIIVVTAFLTQLKSHILIKCYVKKLDSATGKNVSRIYVRQLFGKSMKNFLFTGCELLVYFSPLILFIILESSAGVVYFHVWQKLFLVSVLVSQVYVNSNMNYIVSEYNARGYRNVIYKLKKFVKYTMLITSVSVMLILVTLPFLAAILDAPFANADPFFILSLAVWAFGNTIQHVYGTFVLSYGGGFGFSLIVSVLSAIAIFTTLFISYRFLANPGASLLISGMVYVGAAFLYRKKTRTLCAI